MQILTIMKSEKVKTLASLKKSIKHANNDEDGNNNDCNHVTGPLLATDSREPSTHILKNSYLLHKSISSLFLYTRK